MRTALVWAVVVLGGCGATTSGGRDLASSEDLSVVHDADIDLAAGCGAAGEACCAGTCGTGLLCNGDDHCEPDCDDGNVCTVDKLGSDGDGGVCVHTPAAATVVCRASAGPCDVAETCTGSSPACPVDVLAKNGTVCRAATDLCDAPEVCSGSAAACPADVLATVGTVCRAAAGGCDVAETCSGTTAVCPSDAVAASGTVCRAAAGVCDVAESCNGTLATCPSDVFLPSSTVCRVSAGVCDVAESCTGSQAACPADLFLSASTVCRGLNGACDVAEACSGSQAACPTDTFLPPTTVCRASAGVCDVAENCSGSSGACPGDVLLPSSTVCRVSAGVCDASESCTGSTADCPGDVFLPSSTVCRPAASLCDLAESCTGLGAGCPGDSFAPSGDGTITVDIPFSSLVANKWVSTGCCGGTNYLVANGVGATLSATFTDSIPVGKGVKSVTITWGVEHACNAQPNAMAFSLNGHDIGQWDSSKGPDCSCGDTRVGDATFNVPVADYLAGGTNQLQIVHNQAGNCHEAVTSAPGAAAGTAVRVVVTYGTICRASTGRCDVPESCSGTAGTCPSDGVSPSGTVCRAAAGLCDVAEVCGGSAACPGDGLVASGTTCLAADACNTARVCSGSAAACPLQTDVSSGGACYYLDGSGGTCASGFQRVPQAILATIGPQFAGKTYRSTKCTNCCIWNADAVENYGMSTTDCNLALGSPFTTGPLAGGSGCTNATLTGAGQLTLCGNAFSNGVGGTYVASGSRPNNAKLACESVNGVGGCCTDACGTCNNKGYHKCGTPNCNGSTYWNFNDVTEDMSCFWSDPNEILISNDGSNWIQ